MKCIHVFTVFATPKSFFDGQFRYLTEQGYEIILISSNDPDAFDFAKRNHISFIPIEIPRSISPLAIIRAISQIIDIIKQEKPNVVVGHTPVGGLCAMISSRLCNVKNRIYYRHGVIYTTMKGVKYHLFKLEEKFVALLATAVVNVSHSLSKLAINDGLNSREKQYVIGHGSCGGIDTFNIFNPALIDNNILSFYMDKLGLIDSDIVYGFCGRICNDKGIPELIDAFELFCDKNNSVKAKLLLIGALDIRDKINEHYIEIIEKNSNIIVSGYIEKRILPYYYAMLDVFVFPSHREGFGMCAIEASAMEKPLLVSKVHGCEDTIVEHITGEYISLDSESICKGMELMLNSEIRTFYGDNGRAKATEWYDFQVMWPLVSDMYKNIIS